VKKYGTGSMQFDGTGDYLNVAPSIVNSPEGGDFTVEAWLYNKGYSGSQYGRGWFTLYPSASYATNRLMLRLDTSSDKMNMFLQVADGGGVQFGSSGTNSNASITSNAWTHVAFVRESNSYKLYINGVLDTTLSSSATLADFDKIEIGRTQDGSNPDWNGYIDDLRVPPAAKLPNL